MRTGRDVEPGADLANLNLSAGVVTGPDVEPGAEDVSARSGVVLDDVGTAIGDIVLDDV